MQSVDVADCVLFSLLEYAKGMYGRDLTEVFPKLVGFDERLGKDSAKVEGRYPEEVWRSLWFGRKDRSNVNVRF